MNSLIDFFDSKFIKSISCDKPQQDEYEITNLIKDEKNINFFSNSTKKGFVADTFIRAPISIQIIFNQPINIQKILLDAKVDTKISNGFQIFTSIDSSKKDNFSFYQIARCTNDKKNSPHIYEFTRRNLACSFEDSLYETYKSFFITRSMRYLDEVIAIKITIFRTLNSTAPCLKSIKILGLKPKDLVDLNLPKTLQQNDEKYVEIPNEFIDEITHEMIRNPIRLPSNKIIDKTTLDTLRNNSLNKDPFTCVPFSAVYKPLIDEELKSRIDKFLLDNQGAKFIFKNEENNLGRLSRKRPLNEPKSSSNEWSKHARKESVNDEAASSLLIKCDCCLNFKTEKNDMYELELCKHVYCRHCIKSMNKKCVVCKKSFENNQVVHFDRKMAKN